MDVLFELEGCKTVSDQLAALVTHILDDGEAVAIDPHILRRTGPRRAREIVSGIFKARESGTAYFKHKDNEGRSCLRAARREDKMEIARLENFFKEMTPVTFTTVDESGNVEEEAVKIYHHSPFDQTGEAVEKGTNIMGLLLEAEKDKDNPVPAVTRQLHILGVWSKDFTLGGAPFVLTPAIESIKLLPLKAQRKIANVICAPALEQLRAFSENLPAGAQENGASDDNGADEKNGQPLPGDSTEDRSGGAQAESPEG
jgi:hypothetical protein